MNVRSRHYFDAALERQDDASALYEAGRYTAALYVMGVAIECLLHAFRSRSGKPFAARHDLPTLAVESGIYDSVTDRQRGILREEVAVVAARWRNNYRYVSEDRLLAEFKRRRSELGSKDMSVKAQCILTLTTGRGLLARGVQAWQQSEP